MEASHIAKLTHIIEKIFDRLIVKVKTYPRHGGHRIEYAVFKRREPLLSDPYLLDHAFKLINEGSNGKMEIKIVQDRSASDKLGIYPLKEVWFYAQDESKLGQYKKIIISHLKNEHEEVSFTLNDDGWLSVSGTDKTTNLGFDTLTYKILRLLAERKDYVKTEDMSKILDKRKDLIQKRIQQIKKDILEAEFELNREVMFENNSDGKGYRIMNIEII